MLSLSRFARIVSVSMCLLLALLCAGGALADVVVQNGRANDHGAEAIAVVYPELGEPFRAIFAQIIDGIEDKANVKLRSYPVTANSDTAGLHAQLKRNGTRVVIALGRQGLRAAAGLGGEIAVVTGGILSVPEAESQNLSGISLTPDPDLLFMRLKKLLPGVRRVIVVYHPQNNEWLIRLAREAAKAQGLELLSLPAPDLAGAARLYESTFATADHRQDAVWLPQDAIAADETTLLPLILKESWNRGVPVFSSSLHHVKKGALFALYPDNPELGRALAVSALSLLAGNPPRRGIVPLREVLMALNLRTASHLGLTIGEQQQRTYDLVYPSP